MGVYLYEKKWETYKKDLVNMCRIGSMPKQSCLQRAIGYLHSLKDNKKIDHAQFNKMLHMVNAELESTNQSKMKKLG